MTNISESSHNVIQQVVCLCFMICILATGFEITHAQNISTELQEFNKERLGITKTGMLVLSGWALTNIAVGGYGNFTASGKTKYFHQMNAAWNLVNLGIGTFAYYQALQTDPASLSFAQSLNDAQSLEKFLLLNIGLDVGYIVTGAYLWERGIRKNSDRLLGYGPALLLQGGFLLVFDAILYGVSRSHNQTLYHMLENISITGNQIRIGIPL